ncbi:MAG: DUF2892 domain-containing protein [Colwelliaceae bacterium]|jgi:hypothetical protein|nr:DUF2892 domain-containing protein [Colwelliaceae bacterium]
MNKPLSIESAIIRFAGFMVLTSLTLTIWVHPNFIWFTAFIGANMFQSSFTGFCPAASVFRMLGFKDAANCQDNAS